MGLVLQGAARNLLPYLSAHENVEFAQRAARRARPSAHPGEVLELVGLDTLGRRPLDQLAPGQLQLAALAVALASRPGCCWATSRPASSTTGLATPSWTPWPASTGSGARPSSSSPTTPRSLRGSRGP